MPKAYLIGGTPRTGKTTLATRFLGEQPIMAASTDAIRYVLRHIIKAEDEPDLFRFGKYTSDETENRAYLISNSSDVIKVQNDESVVVWRSVVDFINSNLEDGFDVLIEGIAVLPELVARLTCEYSAVFLGNQSEQHYQTTLNSARSNGNDWLHGLEDETIEAFAVFDQAYSRFIEQEAIKHGMTYVEVHDDNFDTDMNAALMHLRR